MAKEVANPLWSKKAELPSTSKGGSAQGETEAVTELASGEDPRIHHVPCGSAAGSAFLRMDFPQMPC